MGDKYQQGIYDGRKLARSQNVIIVSINYRPKQRSKEAKKQRSKVSQWAKPLDLARGLKLFPLSPRSEPKGGRPWLSAISVNHVTTIGRAYEVCQMFKGSLCDMSSILMTLTGAKLVVLTRIGHTRGFDALSGGFSPLWALRASDVSDVSDSQAWSPWLLAPSRPARQGPLAADRRVVWRDLTDREEELVATEASNWWMRKGQRDCPLTPCCADSIRTPSQQWICLKGEIPTVVAFGPL